ncbi:MAG: hypothetical protein WCX65_17345 [bacterium]
MRKFRSAVATIAVFAILFSAVAAQASSKAPILKGATCESWISYGDDIVYALNFYYREKGMSQMKEEEENALRKSAYAQKLSYIQGLLDAFSQAYDMTGADVLKYSFEKETYIAEIDEFCAEQSNKDQKIISVMARVNNKLYEK